MKHEIRLFVITKFFDAMYDGSLETIKEKLMELLHTKELDSEYWDRWLKRYETLLLSKEIQVTLLKEAGFTYRQMQEVVGVAPNTIRRILTMYDIDYTPLPGSELLEDTINRLDTRLKRAGITLW